MGGHGQAAGGRAHLSQHPEGQRGDAGPHPPKHADLRQQPRSGVAGHAVEGHGRCVFVLLDVKTSTSRWTLVLQSLMSRWLPLRAAALILRMVEECKKNQMLSIKLSGMQRGRNHSRMLDVHAAKLARACTLEAPQCRAPRDPKTE